MRQTYSAGILLFYKENNKIEYLLLHYCDGHWDFPKGQIEKGEAKQQAALRELYEETGLQANIKPGFEIMVSYIFHDRADKKTYKTIYFFVGHVKEKKEVKLSHEHKSSIWLPFEHALEQLTYDNSKKILHKANHFIKRL